MADSMFSLGENSFTRQDGIVLLLFFCVFIYYLISMMRNKSQEKDDENEEIYSLIKSLAFTILGIASIIIGSNLVVNSATSLAQNLGVSQRIIGLTIIALGTSLPELVTSVVATKKGEYDIAIGNVVGSNIFNIGMVLGIPVSLLGGIEIGTFSYLDLGFFLSSALALFIFSSRDYKIGKLEGVMLLTMFVIYYTFILI